MLQPDQPFPDPFPEGGVMLVDKPVGWTSFDVVNKIRHHLSKRLNIKRYKVGHAGTLDPLATGLLILCVGKYTKLIDTLQAQTKEYTGTITFGATTPSYDLEKAPDAFFPTDHLTDEALQSVIPQFLGTIEQFPPVFSAVKVDGKRLYKGARSGNEKEVPSRKVDIMELELGPLRPVPHSDEPLKVISAKGAPIYLHPEFADGLQCDFRVVCGKGTYIRSLAFDIGLALDCGAYLSSLRRTGSGELRVEDGKSPEEWVGWVLS
ncbi:MAG: tRNA pseudouridine(55) synthase TruB [Saprospiraceae bacterium]|nr:tRNA pseudouridine(55) synthase TruB [Saprospiraceae bacterium]